MSELVGFGVPRPEAEALRDLLAVIRHHRSEYVSDGVAEVLGRPARDFTDWARATAATGTWTRSASHPRNRPGDRHDQSRVMSNQAPTTTPTRRVPITGWATLMLYGALVTIGLMAGMYWDWDVAVMPGLTRLDDRSFLDAMQNLIVAIENPGFFLVAFGAFGFTLAAAVLYARNGQRQTALWIAAALALYVVGLPHHHRCAHADQLRPGRRR